MSAINTAAATININTATAEELTAIKGVGVKTAEKVLRLRKEQGLSPEGLEQVIAGLSEGAKEALRDLLSTRPESEPEVEEEAKEEGLFEAFVVFFGERERPILEKVRGRIERLIGEHELSEKTVPAIRTEAFFEAVEATIATGGRDAKEAAVKLSSWKAEPWVRKVSLSQRQGLWVWTKEEAHAFFAAKEQRAEARRKFIESFRSHKAAEALWTTAQKWSSVFTDRAHLIGKDEFVTLVRNVACALKSNGGVMPEGFYSLSVKEQSRILAEKKLSVFTRQEAEDYAAAKKAARKARSSKPAPQKGQEKGELRLRLQEIMNKVAEYQPLFETWAQKCPEEYKEAFPKGLETHFEAAPEELRSPKTIEEASRLLGWWKEFGGKIGREVYLSDSFAKLLGLIGDNDAEKERLAELLQNGGMTCVPQLLGQYEEYTKGSGSNPLSPSEEVAPKATSEDKIEAEAVVADASTKAEPEEPAKKEEADMAKQNEQKTVTPAERFAELEGDAKRLAAVAEKKGARKATKKKAKEAKKALDAFLKKHPQFKGEEATVEEQLDAAVEEGKEAEKEGAVKRAAALVKAKAQAAKEQVAENTAKLKELIGDKAKWLDAKILELLKSSDELKSIYEVGKEVAVYLSLVKSGKGKALWAEGTDPALTKKVIDAFEAARRETELTEEQVATIGWMVACYWSMKTEVTLEEAYKATVVEATKDKEGNKRSRKLPGAKNPQGLLEEAEKMACAIVEANPEVAHLIVQEKSLRRGMFYAATAGFYTAVKVGVTDVYHFAHWGVVDPITGVKRFAAFMSAGLKNWFSSKEKKDQRKEEYEAAKEAIVSFLKDWGVKKPIAAAKEIWRVTGLGLLAEKTASAVEKAAKSENKYLAKAASWTQKVCSGVRKAAVATKDHFVREEEGVWKGLAWSPVRIFTGIGKAIKAAVVKVWDFVCDMFATVKGWFSKDDKSSETGAETAANAAASASS